ncbi:DUF2550 domain-containing protein [Nonomuraea soli]|uniref:DUF2550 family protein n=1 Tax=Nonomuraea soli TaxID=1032476 RepID=A0A7W0CL25_9ACTN|nr:DUF2550 domain-containing protein [Nonomuraea soli]MBA2893056.1 hypothetical protein [Nonomuraea soli]
MTAALTITISCVLLLAAFLVFRAIMLARGTLPCRLQVKGHGWRRGVARYAAGELHWTPLLGVRLRPRHAIARRGLVVSGRRQLDDGLWAIDCVSDRAEVSLAMSHDALTGFLAWLESAPPGAYLDVS